MPRLALALLFALVLCSCSGSSSNVPTIPPSVSPCSPAYEIVLGAAEVTAVAECKTPECGQRARAIVAGLRESAHRYCAEPGHPSLPVPADAGAGGGPTSLTGRPACDGCRLAACAACATP